MMTAFWIAACFGILSMGFRVVVVDRLDGIDRTLLAIILACQLATFVSRAIEVNAP